MSLNISIYDKIVEIGSKFSGGILTKPGPKVIVSEVTPNMILSFRAVIGHLNMVRSNAENNELEAIDEKLAECTFMVSCIFETSEIESIYTFLYDYYKSDMFGGTVLIPPKKESEFSDVYALILVLYTYYNHT